MTKDKANYTPRNGCTSLSTVACLPSDTRTQGQKFLLVEATAVSLFFRTVPDNTVGALIPVYRLHNYITADTQHLLNGGTHYCTIEEVVPVPLEGSVLPSAPLWETLVMPLNTATEILFTRQDWSERREQCSVLGWQSPTFALVSRR